jgi:POT family proton-dependent oligopeptide transporter
MTEVEARTWYHTFGSAVYFFPFLGALLSDLFLGKYRTIMLLSIVYCFGHLALALDDTRTGLLVGLTLIAVGSGGIKPNVGAHVGDQFGAKNLSLRERVFGWFYLAINGGAFFSMLLTPYLLATYGPRVAFAVPGIMMFLATLVFWLGRHRFAHVPPDARGFLKDLCSRDGFQMIGRLGGFFIFTSMFYALYEQTGSAWVLQAEKMNLTFLGYTWLPAQIQAVNPVLILILAPLFTKFWYPRLDRFFGVTPIRLSLIKVGFGFFLTIAAFAVSVMIETMIQQGQQPSVGWQILAYVIITSAEVLVVITALDFTYGQALPRMKSFAMSLLMLSISLGNQIAATVNKFIQNGTLVLDGPNYYGFFIGLMAIWTVAYIPFAFFYRGTNYVAGGARREGERTVTDESDAA